jgi:hypothetical protein
LLLFLSVYKMSHLRKTAFVPSKGEDGSLNGADDTAARELHRSMQMRNVVPFQFDQMAVVDSMSAPGKIWINWGGKRQEYRLVPTPSTQTPYRGPGGYGGPHG